MPLAHLIAIGRPVYLHMLEGELEVNDVRLHGGDALTIESEDEVVLEGGRAAHALLFDLGAHP